MTRPRLKSVVVLAAGWLFACASPALGQAAAPAPRGPRNLQIAGTAQLVTPTSFGSGTATFIAPNGSTVPVTSSESRIGAGFGADLHLGWRVTPTLQAEMTASWVRASYETAVTFDIEGATLLTATEPASRFGAEGAVLWVFRQSGRTEWFARGAAGWSYEVASGTLVDDGPVAHVGIGLRRWIRQATPPSHRRIGIRAEVRVALRSLGFSESTRSLHASPAFVGGFVFGF